MATLKDMINEVKSNLTDYTMRQDRITYLANSSGLNTTDTSVQIGSSTAPAANSGVGGYLYV